VALFSNGSVHMSAKTEYAIRAVTELALAGPGGSLTAGTIADRQAIPVRFLLNILTELRRAGIVDSRRGPSGGWWLARPPAAVSVADVIRAVDGPLADIEGLRPGRPAPAGVAAAVTALWGSVRASIRDILEHTTVADLAGRLSGGQDGNGEADGIEEEVSEDRAG
jgi:Rrf2 family protein